MAQPKRSGTNAPFRKIHERAFKKFESLSHADRVERLIQMGILNKNGDLSRRYGGGSGKNGKSEGKRSAKSSG